MLSELAKNAKITISGQQLLPLGASSAIIAQIDASSFLAGVH